MSEIKERLDLIESCIKVGQFTKAKTLVDRMKIDQIPRTESLRASNLARRCGKVKKSLKILNPVVRNKQAATPANDQEIADYAFSLHRIGASFEAESLLAKVDSTKAPSSLFFKSLIAFSRWEYQRALPWLNEYIQSSELTDYQKLIGRSNRVGVYIFTEKYDKAYEQVSELLEESKEKKLNLLINLSTEQKAQIYVAKNNFDRASKLLNMAEQKSKDSGTLLQTWIWKWKTIISAHEKSESEGLNLLSEAQQEAMRKGAWEVARDFDYYRLKIFNDYETYLKLYFGTPFPHYIERLNKIRSDRIPSSYQFRLGQWQEGTGQRIINLDKQYHQGEIQENFELTEMQIRLLKSLLLDFYRPPKWGDLFNCLFPEEYFDPFSSINRLHQILYRLNQSLKDQGLGFRIVSDTSGCRILSSNQIAFEIHSDMEDQLYADPQLLKLRDQNLSEFTINDICQLYGGSKRTQRRWIKKMLEEGKLLKIGNNRSSRYKLSS